MAAKYRLRLGNDQHEVEVEPDHAGGYRVKVGDKTSSVSLERINDSARYSLIVDGRGLPGDDALTVVPNRAVLHRKAQQGVATKPGCKDDCHPLEA